MKRFDIRPLILGLVAAGTTPAMAQNLIANPTFDTDYSGWPAGGAEWVADDCCGNPASGSIRVVQFDRLWSNCMSVTAGNAYDLTFWTKYVGVLNLVNPNGFALVVWMNTPTCEPVFDLSPYHGVPPGNDAAWHHVGATFIAPAGAQSVAIVLGGNICGITCGGYTSFDDVAFGPAGTVPVELQSFEID